MRDRNDGLTFLHFVIQKLVKVFQGGHRIGAPFREAVHVIEGLGLGEPPAYLRTLPIIAAQVFFGEVRA
jgi:hypothetical protein